MYEVVANLPEARVHARLSGFFSLDEVEAFGREEQDAARRVTLAWGWFDLLVDVSDGITQGQEVMGAFNGLLDQAEFKARRIALVVGSTLLRLQLRRVLASERIGIFAEVEEGEAWLAATATAGAADSRSEPSPARIEARVAPPVGQDRTETPRC